MSVATNAFHLPDSPVITPPVSVYNNFGVLCNHAEKVGADYGSVKVVSPPGSLFDVHAVDVDPQAVIPLMQQTVLKQYPDKQASILHNATMKKIPYHKFRDAAARMGAARKAGQHDIPAMELEFWSAALSSEFAGFYGADIPGTVYPKRWPWSPRRLPTILTECIDVGVTGVTHPMLYFGMWAACFAWHTEDKDLNSINHLHFGAPKVWYSVPAAYKTQVDALAASIAPAEFARCSQFIRHKQMVIHPSTLTAAGIPVFTTVQYPGDTILTMAGAYHCGFNTGLNLAESCNYATFNWLALASTATVCSCMPDAVRIGMDTFHERLRLLQQGIPRALMCLVRPDLEPIDPAHRAALVAALSQPLSARLTRAITQHIQDMLTDDPACTPAQLPLIVDAAMRKLRSAVPPPMATGAAAGAGTPGPEHGLDIEELLHRPVHLRNVEIIQWRTPPGGSTGS